MAIIELALLRPIQQEEESPKRWRAVTGMSPSCRPPDQDLTEAAVTYLEEALRFFLHVLNLLLVATGEIPVA
jgi:hypothetical protein